jgi:ferredoxin
MNGNKRVRKWPARIRATVGVAVFCLITLLFLEVSSFLVTHSAVFSWPQFAPSILRFAAGGAGFLGLGFVFVAIFTLLFGRVYCAALCPLGVFQDAAFHLHRMTHPQKGRFHKPIPFLRYVSFAAVALSMLLGNMALLSLLDPWSIFGRIVADLGKPIVSGISALLEVPLHAAGISDFTRLTWNVLPWTVFVITLVFAVGIFVLAFLRGRLWCNTFCPVGAFLGLLSRFSLFRFRFHESCISCNTCSRNCRADCIDVSAKRVDASRCVACFDCVVACPTGDMFYGRFIPVKSAAPEKPAEPSRREFLKSAALGTAALALFFLPGKIHAAFSSAGTISLITPPGSQGLERFRSKCTACHLCVSSCPDRILTPSFLENGLSSLMQPRMDYHAGFCSYDCVKCGHVCPTGAILPQTVEKKRRIQLGVASFSLPKCVVKLKGTHCGACSEVCPTKACTMIPWENGLEIPFVRESICIGCGACQHACPAGPKAILVQGYAVHRTALDPTIFREAPNQQKKFLGKPQKPENDFPF